MTKTYKSEAYAALHEMMEGLHDTGAIDTTTLREFDEACLASLKALRAAIAEGLASGASDELDIADIKLRGRARLNALKRSN